ncbi:MAG: HAD-IA family hydrolase [Dehalococcoidia bacterium]|nr:HAD-IA family hydrolase [Dehalococcoidia bacterium]
MPHALPRPLRAVLLDIDGTILDTREFIFAAFEHAFLHHRLPPPPREELSRHVGQRELHHIYSGFAEEFAAAMTELHRDFQAANLELAVPYPGAEAVLSRLTRAGLRLAAVTSRSVRTSARTLELNGLAGYFATVVSAEDVQRLKPHPEPLLAALERMGRPPEAAVMVGDTAADMEAGRAAGLFTVAATYGFQGPGVLDSAPDAAIGAIGELPRLLGL